MKRHEPGGPQPTDFGLPAQDIDLLADYLAGVLAGTPAEAEVAHRIRDNAGWAHACAALAETTSLVTAELADWGRQAEPMPTDIARRLSAVLADVDSIGVDDVDPDRINVAAGDADPGDAGSAGLIPTATVSTDAGMTASPVTDQRRLKVVSAPAGSEPSHAPGGRPNTGRRPGGNGPFRTRQSGAGRRRWRERPWVRPVTAAAAALILVGFGVWFVPQVSDSTSQQTTDAVGAAPETMKSDLDQSGRRETEKGPFQLTDPQVRSVVVSGTDYARTTLGATVRIAPQPSGTETAGAQSAGPDQALRSPDAALPPDTAGKEDAPTVQVIRADKVAASLRRLTSAAALSACLAAIGSVHPRPTSTTELVDYASFEGAPALLVTFVDIAGERWAWAAGPDCGLPDAGADTRYRARIG